jgi:hypothetical protein
MGKSSRSKRRTYQTPKRARTGANLVWYAAAFVLLVGGTLAVALSRSNSANGIGPQSGDHWHAALGVQVCGTWTPNWLTPVAPAGTANAGGPVRAGSLTYAGLHSHGDGLIHMEPQTSDEMGKSATLGRYFKFAGFTLNATEIKFGTLDPSTTVSEKNGDKCDGNPASYKIFNGDVIELVFTTADAKLPPKTEVPSYTELQDIIGNPNKSVNPPGVTTPNNAATTTTPGATTTAAPTTTSTPAGATSTTTP